MELLKCSICENIRGNTIFTAKELMLGLRDEFEYIECKNCGCLQIKKIPPNLSEYYPRNYYAYNEISEEYFRRKHVNNLARKLIISHRMGNKNILGQLLTLKYGHIFKWIKKGILNFDSKILDVGCGSGRLILSMHYYGFTSLTGIDPYIEREISYPCGVRVHKVELSQIQGKFDFIMLHHSFEHMVDPLKTLGAIYELLNPNCYALLRIPVTKCFAWRKYGSYWVAIDAPRHLFIHTTKSIQILAAKIGFELKEITYDSHALQFIGSEKYVRDIPLKSPNKLFSEKQIKAFAKEAKRLNSINEGDNACFYLYKGGNIQS